MTFETLEQRLAASYLDIFPQFVPDEKADVSIAHQKEFYDFMKNLYQLIYDEPLLVVPELHEDDAFPNRFNKSSYGKPDLQANMRKFLKQTDALLHNMFLLGQDSSVKLNKRQKAVLSKLGIDNAYNLPQAWKWMSSRLGANKTAFSYCLFDNDYIYTSDIYANLLGEEAFRKLEKWMIENGYKKYDIYDVTASSCKLSLTYANPAWSKEHPKGGFEYKIKHTGISARYDILIKQPAVFGLCIPNGLKPYLLEFESMNEKNQEFIVKYTRKCDVCRYCVQTDKTGLRPLAFIPVKHRQTEYELCTYFPGYNFCWTSMDDELANQLIDLLSFMDKFAP